MTIKLVEIDFTFHIPIPAEDSWKQIIIRAGKLKGQLHWTFKICGPENAGDDLPIQVAQGIQEALTWSRTQVRGEDLKEHDRDCCIEYGGM